MHEYENPADEADGRSDAMDSDPVIVAVVRSGGIAGLPRRWRAEADADRRPEWLALVERCPWGDAPDDVAVGADRFVWSIHARVHDEQLEQVLPDAHLQGAWRELVDAVRDADQPPVTDERPVADDHRTEG
ncbi:hypothetical protein FM104_02850 [Microbacterium esteraromaticum]|uniref:Uncharacterized protein n=1 Tax=Microbacterium esteraromaticum TaxID=57043 RepID=A0A1R4IMN2_9MICO|nr:protealysin inhibitor emfourin [Microbacterium esteraromaticum]SJN20874.1 hypothetical protein FM104_02850 [Microbacterium esteraromaticum]